MILKLLSKILDYLFLFYLKESLKVIGVYKVILIYIKNLFLFLLIFLFFNNFSINFSFDLFHFFLNIFLRG